jgi:hypothetical protein
MMSDQRSGITETVSMGVLLENLGACLLLWHVILNTVPKLCESRSTLSPKPRTSDEWNVTLSFVTFPDSNMSYQSVFLYGDQIHMSTIT